MRRIAAGLLAVGLGSIGAAGLLGLTGCTKIPPPTPLSELNAQQLHGHTVFEVRCAVCHYDRQDGPLHGPSLRGTFKKEYLPSGAPANDDRVMATIIQGRGNMPAMGKTMTPQERDDLMAYLHTL